MRTSLTRSALLSVALLPCTVHASVPSNPATIVLDRGTFVGNLSGNTASFLGIPFAQPPVGNLRFRLPVPNPPYDGTVNATQFGSSCIQQSGQPIIPVPPPDPSTLQVLERIAAAPPGLQSEDCLTVNVIKPANVSSSARLPVLVWIYGGGFEGGGSVIFDGRVIVERSLALGEPVIYVSMNYRVSALGSISGREVVEAGIGNLGLHDQRQAFRWVQKYIHAFGGDPKKVTIWGESAGAVSASLHMVANGGNTEGLFRAAFMNSGAPPPDGDSSNGQPLYDALVAATNCTGSTDTLECLRRAQLSAIQAAQNASPYFLGFSSVNVPWTPRADGSFLTAPFQKLVIEGNVAKIPFVSGNCDDEGTLFSLSSYNVTTDAEALDYIRSTYFPHTSNSSLSKLLELYPNDPAVGSPFDTGSTNAITPQFKRLASLQGDLAFQSGRRLFLQHLSGTQPAYSFLSKRFKTFPDVGSFHSSDLQNAYGPGDMTDYLIRFVATLNPNGNTGIPWPLYTNKSPRLLTFLDGATPLTITEDSYRIPQMEFLTELLLANPL
ncbi:carotenoid ester lipase precursor [Gloeopeniophorella convolvens]|nr:carotenoid ester lipase precursor [Gloeopeniophorella convolvens]